MGIIEKLGITPGPWKWCSEHGVEHKSKMSGWTASLGLEGGKLTPNRRIIVSAPEMLEALIIDTVHDDEYLICNFGPIDNSLRNRMSKAWHKPGEMVYDDYMRKRSVIEKATGKSWPEIKALYNAE